MNNRSSKRSEPSVLGSPLLIALLAVGIVFFVILGVQALKKKDAVPAGPADTTPVVTADGVTTDGTETAASTQAPVPSTEAPGTTQAAETLPTQTEAVTTVPATEPAPTEPESQMMEVDDRYFADALFIGDSRTDGLRLYSNPGDSKHYCGTSMTIFKIMDTTEEAYGYTGIRALLQGMQFGKIYIMFGINECGYDTGAFADKFRSVVEEIRSYQPDALIYIQSILYVTQNHEAKNPVFSTANLKEKNAKLKELANGEDIFYLEVNDCLNDGTDHLPSEYTGDGVHLKANYYYLWHDYLLQHAVVDAKHPWSPEASEAEGAEVEHP